MHILYELETGRAHSQSAESFTNPDPTKWGIKETQNVGIWNKQTLDFDPRPIDKKMSKLEFLNLFTDAELAGILATAKLDAGVEVFVKKLDAAEFVDLDYPGTIAGLNALEAGGLLSAGRAGEILNG